MKPALILALVPLPALATSPACDGAVLPCRISWIEDGAKQTARFDLAHDEFGFHHFGLDDGIFRFEIPASHGDLWPLTLRDFDGDGRIDIGLFALSGMVNGSFAMFRRTQDGFAHWETLFGHTFLQDESGLVTATGRSSCCEVVTRFHTPDGDDLEDFALSIRPDDAPAPDGTTGHVLPPADSTTIRTVHGPMIDAHCGVYEEGKDRAAARAVADLFDSTAEIVPPRYDLPLRLRGRQARHR